MRTTRRTREEKAPASRRDAGNARPAPIERLLALQRHAGNRAVSNLIARQDEPAGQTPVETPIGPPILTDVQVQFLLGLRIDPASLPTEVQVRLGSALERTRRVHQALRGNMSVDLGGGDAQASSVVTDTGASMSVTVTDDQASITIRREYDFASGRLVQSFSYEDVDARALHATLETEGPHVLIEQVPIALEGPEGVVGVREPPPPLGDEEIDTFEDAITAEPASSDEGVGSFVSGAIAGDFAENDSFSAIAGQTVVGLIPIAGQIADVRDMASAIRGVAQGRDGALLNVGIAAIGFIPGLDFLKGGSRVGRRALREAAEASVDRAARSGLKRASRVLSKEAAQVATRRLKALKTARIEMIERLRRLSRETARHPELTGVAGDTVNALERNFKPSDLSGALRDRLGIPVRRSGSGAAFDHLQEVTGATNSLRRTREQLLREMNRLERGSPDFRRMSDLSDAVGELIRKTEELLNP